MEESNQLHAIQEKDLLFSIWTKPKQTLELILRNYPGKYVTVLLVLGGIASSLDRASSRDNGSSLSVTVIIILAIVAGGFFGWLSYYIYAALMSWTGGWLKGRASTREFLTVIAWSNIPFICSLVLWVFRLIVFGNASFNPDVDALTNTALGFYYAFELIAAVLGIWSFVIAVQGVMLLQDFNVVKAILNIILPALVLIIPIIIIVGIIFMLQKG